jgi:hypothetical protein
MRLRHTMVVLAVVCTASLAQAVLVSQGVITINTTAPTPSTSVYGYAGGGIAFIPGGTDSVGQDTLVINWAMKDTVDTTKYNQVYQRITIPAGGGAPTVLATATIRWDFLFDGVTQYGSSHTADIAFDATNEKLVVNGPSNRFIAFDLFASDTTVSSVGYSKPNGDNTTQFGKVVMVNPAGQYQSFYTYGTNVRTATLAPGDMNGTVNMTKTDVAKASFTGWYPDTSAYPHAVDGFNTEGAVAYGDDGALVLRNYKNSAMANRMESHLYMAGSALDAAAINAFSDLGNATELTTAVKDLTAWGLTADPTAGVAYVRYGYINQAGSPGYNRILMVGGLPVVPEPATLALVIFGACGLLLRRRHA